MGCGEAVAAEADWVDDEDPGRGDDGSLLPPGDGLLASLCMEGDWQKKNNAQLGYR